MNFKRFTALLTTTSIVLQISSPLFAVGDTIDGVQKNTRQFPKIRSLPASLTFEASAGKTGAGVLHYARGKDGKIQVLLGLRDDQETWCNLGGVSDEESTSSEALSADLAQTAAREVEEESNGIFAHHPRLLRLQPFIDTFDPVKNKGFLYRMYWQEVQYVPEETLKAEMEKATKHHCKEYRDFRWVSVQKVLQAIRAGHSIVRIDEQAADPAHHGEKAAGDATAAGSTSIGKDLTLFSPLFKTLSTPAGNRILKTLSENGQLSASKKEHQSRLYVLSGDDSPLSDKDIFDEDISVHWIHQDISQPQDRGYHPLPFGQDASGRTSAKRQIIRQTEVLWEEEVPFDAARAEDTFAAAVAAHGIALMELKEGTTKLKKFDGKFSREVRVAKAVANAKVRNATARASSVTPSAAPAQEGSQASHNEDLTPSQTHLLMVLGPEYKRPSDFPDAADAHRAADLANIREYSKRYTNNAEFCKAEIKHDVTLLDSDYECLADVLAWDRAHQKDATFFHAANEELSCLFRAFTNLREVLTLTSLKHNLALRGTGLYFHGVKTMADVFKEYGLSDYEKGRHNLVLSANFALLAGLTTTRTTSSSLAYLLANHSVAPPDVAAKFEEATALNGFTASFSYYESLFKQFLAYRNPSHPNSVMLGLRLKRELLDTYTSRGHLYTAENAANEENSTQHTLDAISQEAQRLSLNSEKFDVETERKRKLFPEARILLHPNIMYDPEKVQVEAFDRFPLTPEQQKTFTQEMGRVSWALAADWLAQKTTTTEDKDPPLKALYKRAYKALTGQDAQETLATESFVHLVRQGHLEGVKQFLTLNSAVLQSGKITPEDLLSAAIESHNPQMLPYVIEDVLRTTASALYSPQQFSVMIRKLLALGKSESLSYLLQNYERLQEIPRETKLFWVDRVKTDPSLPTFLSVLMSKDPELTPDIVQAVIAPKQNNTFISTALFEHVIRASQTSPQKALEMYAAYIADKNPAAGDIYEKLECLHKAGADLFAQDLKTGEPLIFKFKNTSVTDVFLDSLSSSPGFFTARNKEGLTWLQLLQREYMEGGPNTMPYIFEKIFTKSGRSYEAESYPPFAQMFPQMFPNNNIVPKNPFRYPDTRQWLERLMQENTPEGLTKLAQTCPDPQLLLHDTRFNFSNILSTRWYTGYETRQKWLEEISAAIASNDKSTVTRLISTFPPGVEEFTSSPILSSLRNSAEEIKALEDTYITRRDELMQTERTWADTVKTAIGTQNLQTTQEALTKMPDSISYEIFEELDNLLKSTFPVPNIQDLQEAARKKIEDWNTEMTAALSATPYELPRLSGLLDHVPLIRELQQYVAYFTKKDLLPLLPRVLRILYPEDLNVKKYNDPIVLPFDFSFENISLIGYALLFQHISLQALSALGQNLDSAETEKMALQSMTTMNFGGFLDQSDVSQVQKLWGKYPDIFTLKTETQDFFGASLMYLPAELRQALALKYKEKLKEQWQEARIPYLWLLLDDEEDIGFLSTLFQEDPSLGELTTPEGATIYDYMVEEENFSSAFQKKIRVILENAKKRMTPTPQRA